MLRTNTDALTIPAAGGVDTSIVIVGDCSSGNDGPVRKFWFDHGLLGDPEYIELRFDACLVQMAAEGTL